MYASPSRMYVSGVGNFSASSLSTSQNNICYPRTTNHRTTNSNNVQCRAMPHSAQNLYLNVQYSVHHYAYCTSYVMSFSRGRCSSMCCLLTSSRCKRPTAQCKLTRSTASQHAAAGKMCPNLLCSSLFLLHTLCHVLWPWQS